MSRSALIAAVAAVTCLATPAAAPACLLQGGGANPVGHEPSTPVHPGDAMQFTISKLDENAKYEVTIGGHPIESGAKPEGSGFGDVVRPFTLGDYGPAARNLAVVVYVSHTGAGTGHDDDFEGLLPEPVRLHYVPAGQAQPPAEADHPSGSPATSRAPAADAVPVPAASPAGTTPVRSAPRTTARRTAPSERTATGSLGVAHGAAEPARPTVTVQVVRAARPAPSAATALAGTRPAPRHGAPAPPRSVASAAVLASQLRLGDDKAIRAATPLAGRRASVPGRAPVALLVALALIALAGGGLGWALRRRAAAAPEPPERPPDAATALAVEAELQEIIAEQRAADAVPAPPTHAAH